jgi:hypothetical protein
MNNVDLPHRPIFGFCGAKVVKREMKNDKKNFDFNCGCSFDGNFGTGFGPGSAHRYLG